MIRFTIGHCDLKTNLQSLRKLANDVFYRYHNSQRGKKISLGDDKYPNLKVSGDIFSIPIWVKTEEGEEQRIFLDGDVFLNTAIVHTVTVEGATFSEEIVKEFKKVLQSLTKIGEGCCYAEIDKAPVRFENGKIQSYSHLISELYQSLSEDKKEEHQALYEALTDGFSYSRDDY